MSMEDVKAHVTGGEITVHVEDSLLNFEAEGGDGVCIAVTHFDSRLEAFEMLVDFIHLNIHEPCKSAMNNGRAYFYKKDNISSTGAHLYSSELMRVGEDGKIKNTLTCKVKFEPAIDSKGNCILNFYCNTLPFWDGIKYRDWLLAINKELDKNKKGKFGKFWEKNSGMFKKSK